MDNKLLNKFQRYIYPEPNTGCWIWGGASHPTGYGRFCYKYKLDYAHRWSYKIFNGEIPISDSYHGTCVLHKCDNPFCVNPDHLFLGTQGENMHDRNKKARDARGLKHGRSKLSERDISIIFELNQSGATNVDIASKLNVSPTTVRNVVLGITWSHLGYFSKNS